MSDTKLIQNFIYSSHKYIYFSVRDATAKSVTGILTGSISQFGQFQECLEAQAPFPTQYCLVSITANISEANPPRNPKSLEYDSNESVLRKIQVSFLGVALQLGAYCTHAKLSHSLLILNRY